MNIHIRYDNGAELDLTAGPEQAAEIARSVLGGLTPPSAGTEPPRLSIPVQRYDDGYCDGFEAGKIGDEHGRELLPLYREEAGDPTFPEPAKSYAQGFVEGYEDCRKYRDFYRDPPGSSGVDEDDDEEDRPDPNAPGWDRDPATGLPLTTRELLEQYGEL